MWEPFVCSAAELEGVLSSRRLKSPDRGHPFQGVEHADRAIGLRPLEPGELASLRAIPQENQAIRDSVEPFEANLFAKLCLNGGEEIGHAARRVFSHSA